MAILLTRRVGFKTTVLLLYVSLGTSEGILLMGIFSTALQVGMTARENAKQRKFAERMSNTAYQRGMADMRKAGLNPILAYQKGGASAPTAGGSSFSPSMDLAGTAISALQAKAGIANTKQQEATSAQTAKTIEQDRINKKPGQEYQADKDAIKRDALRGAIEGTATSQITAKKVGKMLTVGPDFSNFLGKKDPGGSYIERYKRSRSRSSAHRRNIKSTRRGK